MTERALTILDACHLADIVRAAQSGNRVARLIDGDVFCGTARSIGDKEGNFARATEDIRDAYLRVTEVRGFDCFWKVSDLMDQLVNGEFVTDYTPSARGA